MSGTKQRSDKSRLDSGEVLARDADGEEIPIREIPSQNQLAGVIETPEEKEAIRQAIELAGDRSSASEDDATVITGTAGHFVISQPQFKTDEFGNRYTTDGMLLDFQDGRVATKNKDLVKAVEEVLAGKRGEELQQQAQRYQITVQKKSGVVPPIPAWHTLAEHDVLTVAVAAGALDNLHQVKNAVKAEKARPKELGGPREAIVAQLEAWEATNLDSPRNNPVAPRDSVNMAL